MDQFSLEEYFMKFFYKIAKEENAFSSTSTNADCLRKVKVAFHKKTFETGDSDIRFDSPEIRCAYLFQYTTLFSSAVAFHFMQLLNRNQIMLDRLLAQDSVIVCCLGGGPATEVVAIAKALDEMMSVWHFNNQRLKKMEVIIIDIDSDWFITAQHVVENLNNSAALQFSLSFIQSDLAEPLTEEVQNALGKAHIVTTVKIVSVIYSAKGEYKTRQMVQRIARFMQDGALLFFFDSSVSKYYNAFRNAMSSTGCMREIYGPLENNVYTLSPPILTECHKLYSESYGKQCFAPKTKNYVNSWYKEGYQRVPFQTPAVWTSQLTTNAVTNLPNGPCFNPQLLSQRIHTCAPYYHGLIPYLTAKIKKRTRKPQQTYYSHNYVNPWCKEEYQQVLFQTPSASTGQFTNNVTPDLWNGLPCFNSQLLSQRVGTRAPYYRNLNPYLTAKRKKRRKRKPRQTGYFKNYQ